MKRRQFLALLAAVALPRPKAAAAQGRQVRIGVLAPASPAASQAVVGTFREGLRELGYVEGQNLSIDFRPLDESSEQNASATAELVRSNVDVILAWNTSSVLAARRATSTVPIVMVGVADPVEMGIVTSLARPGGNVTGISNLTRDLSGKLVELFVEIVPGMTRIGVVRNPFNPALALLLRETEDAIRAKSLQLLLADARAADEFERAFTYLGREGVHGVLLLANASVIEYGREIADMAQRLRLPTAFQRRENVELGGLFSYGSNLRDQFRQAASYVDRILKGARPGDLPIEQPTKFELVINLKTAKALGLTIPPTLLARADEVIE